MTGIGIRGATPVRADSNAVLRVRLHLGDETGRLLRGEVPAY